MPDNAKTEAKVPASLDKMLNWKLYKGSHKWPNNRGGTCINEAAIVVAGFEYRRVANYSDLPECFSPVLGAYMIGLNDSLSLKKRQALIPFVTRLAGSRDTDTVEMERAERIVSKILCPLRRNGYLAMTLLDGHFGEAAHIAHAMVQEYGHWYALYVARDIFAIGKQADPLETAVIVERVKAAKATPAPAT